MPLTELSEKYPGGYCQFCGTQVAAGNDHLCEELGQRRAKSLQEELDKYKAALQKIASVPCTSLAWKACGVCVVCIAKEALGELTQNPG